MRKYWFKGNSKSVRVIESFELFGIQVMGIQVMGVHVMGIHVMGVRVIEILLYNTGISFSLSNSKSRRR